MTTVATYTEIDAEAQRIGTILPGWDGITLKAKSTEMMNAVEDGLPEADDLAGEVEEMIVEAKQALRAATDVAEQGEF